MRSYEADQEASAVLLEGKIRVVASGTGKNAASKSALSFSIKNNNDLLTDRVQLPILSNGKKEAFIFIIRRIMT